jgi:nitroimidazol reductase NimA-like FMN-containing flavoprotein (pyridoxamine 5'-phosphate oxidase superfamily)
LKHRKPLGRANKSFCGGPGGTPRVFSKRAPWGSYLNMRRKENEIKDFEEIVEIIQKAEVCRLGLAVDNTPYVVPVNYGYDPKDNCLYIHCAKQGRKLDMIKQNNTVCFEMDVDAEIRDRDKPACNWNSTYRSVIGYGKAFLIDDFEQKKKALDILMKHYCDRESFEYKKETIEKVGIIKITITELSGKKSV